MKRKLLFFDIDGTLVQGGAGQASQPVIQAIRQARANGHLAFLSTGRSEMMVDDTIKEIGFDGGIFSAGGKVVFNGEKIADYPLKQETVAAIMDIFDHEKNVFYLLECDQMNYKGNMPADYRELLAGSEREGASTELLRILSVLSKAGQKNAADYDGMPVYKVSFFSLDKVALDRATERMKPLGKVLIFENMAEEFGVFSGEINDWKINKGVAIADICKHLRADMQDTIAFGDSANDLEMIEAAGLGIAMRNATDDVKVKADRICESVTDDGVVHELKRLQLIK